MAAAGRGRVVGARLPPRADARGGKGGGWPEGRNTSPRRGPSRSRKRPQQKQKQQSRQKVGIVLESTQLFAQIDKFLKEV